MLAIIRVTAHNHKSETTCTSTSATLMCFVCPGVMVVSNEIPVRIVGDVVVVVVGGFFCVFLTVPVKRSDESKWHMQVRKAVIQCISLVLIVNE